MRKRGAAETQRTRRRTSQRSVVSLSLSARDLGRER
jgi:hypothetical protein